jgi:hypothetical protein
MTSLRDDAASAGWPALAPGSGSAAGERILKRVEMWCARHWCEARDAGLVALASGDLKAYQRQRHDEQEWFAAMLVVNRLTLGIEPLRGERFLDARLEVDPPSR